MIGPEMIALVTAMSYAGSDTLGRVGLKTSTPATAVAVTSLVNAILLWGIALITVPWSAYRLSNLWIFFLDGILVQALARLCLYTGMKRIGLPRTSAVTGSTPVFAILIAIFFLREAFTVFVLAGAALIALGIFLVSERGGTKSFHYRDLLFPLATAVLYGLSPNLRKLGFAYLDYPMLGAAVSSTMSIPALLIITRFWTAGRQMVFTRHAVVFYALAGTASTLGLITYFYALQMGQVVIIAPLASTATIFVALYTHLFLRQFEQFTKKILLGALAVVAGAFLVIIK
ncbi:MAG: EamA family transporter [Thermodesulfobacteriota bacterium]